MKVALLTQHPNNHASRRLLAELPSLQVLSPYECRVHWPLHDFTPRFDLTLNRIASIEDESFMKSLMNWPVWGQQVNAWEIRQTLWDKTRQSLWMAQQQWPLLPFFTHRGTLSAEDPAWRAFHDQHLTPDGWVLKMNRGQRGVGVHFLKTEMELLSWCETLWRMGDQDFLIQPRVAQGPEYRITLLGQKVWAVLKRSSDKAVANFAQGGEARELLFTEWPFELKRLIDQITARPVAQVLSLDILMSAHGPVISDINTVPGFEQLEAVTGRNFAGDLLKGLLNS
jgi:hypothetical protein